MELDMEPLDVIDAGVLPDKEGARVPDEARRPPATQPGTHTTRTRFVAVEVANRRSRKRRLCTYGALGPLLLAVTAAYLYHIYLSAVSSRLNVDAATARLNVSEPPLDPVVADPATPRRAAGIATAAARAHPPSAESMALPNRGQQGVREAARAGQPVPPPAATPATLAAEQPVPRPAIVITRREAPPAPDPLLVAAYESLLRGDTAMAQNAWVDTLQRDPNNRDALLGLAASLARQGDSARARTLYLRLLDREPDDLLALTGLMGLQQPVDPVARESELKRLLRANPRSARVHFALGNHHAGQRQWAAAQAAYFSAVSADDQGREGQNPDYAFNLAVALEHLGRRDAALRYYQRALELAGDRVANFDPMVARSRVAALQEHRR